MEKMEDRDKRIKDYERISFLLEELLYAYECRIKSSAIAEKTLKSQKVISHISLIKSIEENVILNAEKCYDIHASLENEYKRTELEIEILKKRILERYRKYAIKEGSDFRYLLYSNGIGIIGYIGFNDFEVDIPGFIDGLPVIKIEPFAFYQTPFKNIKIPTSVVEIGNNAFANCPNLHKIRLPDDLLTVGESCFQGSGIVELSINVEIVPRNCFGLCKNLEKVVIGEKVKKISSFSTSFPKIIVIPPNVETIEENAFGSTNSFMKNRTKVYCRIDSKAYEWATNNHLKIEDIRWFSFDEALKK